MSIIVKPNCTGSIGGGSNKGFPPASVNIIEIKTISQQIVIKWQDPENTMIDDSTIVTWAGTVLVRNDSHYPTNVKDGIIVVDNKEKNKYKDTWFEDTGLVNEHTYYYRFFTYSIDDVYNNNSEVSFKATPYPASSILSENSWDTISIMSETGMAKNVWSIGDTITIHLEGFYSSFNLSVDIPFRILDFDHFDKSDGSGKAGILFGSDYGISHSSLYMFTANVNSYGWGSCTLRSRLQMNDSDTFSFGKLFPNDLKSVIKEINTTSTNAINGTDIYEECADKIFILSTTELFGDNYNSSYPYKTQGYQIPMFTTNDSRLLVKHLYYQDSNNASIIEGSANYFTRSRTPDGINAYYSCEKNGTLYIHSATDILQVRPCFCV